MIEEIALEDTLPRVFEHEKIPASEIWRKSVTLLRGKHYLIEAASGTGKSSLCSFIFGLRSDFLGRILFKGDVKGAKGSNRDSERGTTDSSSLTVNEWQRLRRESIAYLPQELALFPELTALQNIRLKNNLTNALSEERIMQMLEQLGIDHRADYPVGRMSIGQQQRVGIIRALAQPFDFILLDEPVSHLDADNNRIVARMVEEEAARYGAAIVATSVGNQLMLEHSEILKL